MTHTTKLMTNKSISEVVKEFVDEVLCRVQTESGKTDHIRKIAERIIEELIIEANEAAGKKKSCAGDVNGLSEKVHHPRITASTQHGQFIEGQTITQAGFPNSSKNKEQLVSDSRRSNSLSALPTWLNSKTLELCLQQNRSTEALCINQQLITEEDNTPSDQDIKRKYVISRDTNDNKEPCITWESMYPKYALVKVVKISKKEKIVHSNGVLDNEEVKRIVVESDKILKKKKGFLSVVRKLFRRMLFCFPSRN